MRKVLSTCLILALMLIFGAGSVLAADQKRDRKRDGSCRNLVTTESCAFDLAFDRQRDRKRDGSCKKISSSSDESITTAADRARDRKRDGSCRS
jgi:hypothetical protein